jgi:hypothetical protein
MHPLCPVISIPQYRIGNISDTGNCTDQRISPDLRKSSDMRRRHADDVFHRLINADGIHLPAVRRNQDHRDRRICLQNVKKAGITTRRLRQRKIPSTAA